VVPKIEVDQFFDLSDDILSQLMPFCKRVSKAMQEVIDCERIGMTVIGLEVPHAHVHLIPISNLADMSFSKERLKFSSDDYETIAKKIRDNFK
jgi:histidine triad (HIT) family protein